MAIVIILLLMLGFIFFVAGARGFWVSAEQPTNWRIVSAGLACWLAAYFLQNVIALVSAIRS